MSAQLSHFHFIRPGWLLLVPVALGLWWLWHRRTDPLHGWRKQIAPDLLHALVVGRATLNRGPATWLLTGWLLGVIAVAGPTWRLEPSPFADDATPLMILLKTDVSMDTPDPAPSRLERAQLKIADIAEARAGQPLGLVAYAGSAHLVLPPTRDTAVVASMAAELDSTIMPRPGDRLDLGLREAARVLETGNQGGSIVVVADSVSADPDTLQAQRKSLTCLIQFLAIHAPESTPSESLRAAARSLDARVEPLRVDDNDIAAIVRRAANTPVARAGEQSGRWQEAGYWIVPMIGLIFLASCRREQPRERANDQ